MPLALCLQQCEEVSDSDKRASNDCERQSDIAEVSDRSEDKRGERRYLGSHRPSHEVEGKVRTRTCLDATAAAHKLRGWCAGDHDSQSNLTFETQRPSTNTQSYTAEPVTLLLPVQAFPSGQQRSQQPSWHAKVYKVCTCALRAQSHASRYWCYQYYTCTRTALQPSTYLSIDAGALHVLHPCCHSCALTAYIFCRQHTPWLLSEQSRFTSHSYHAPSLI